ncbi:MAG: metallophosphoesterase [Clostridia bacterium]
MKNKEKTINARKINLIFLLKISTCILLAVLICFLLFLFSYTGGRADLPFESSKVENANIKPFVDDFGYQSFKKDSDRDFKILQLSDLHFGNGFLSYWQDKASLKAVDALVRNSKPDLIIVTGDVVYPVPFQSGSRNNLLAMTNISKFIDGFCIPWTIVFGNHDAEFFSTNRLSDLCDVLENQKYCIFKKNDVGICGLGNNFVNIYNQDGSKNTSIALFFTGKTVNDVQFLGYESIQENQIKWYEDELKKMSGEGPIVSSLAFMHVPFYEYKTAWKAHLAGSSDAVLHFGSVKERRGKISTAKNDSEIFERMIALGSTKGVFAGHDHLNDFSLTYRGIRLTFGKSIDYLAYLGINKVHDQRGATNITIGNDSSFNVESIRLRDIV